MEKCVRYSDLLGAGKSNFGHFSIFFLRRIENLLGIIIIGVWTSQIIAHMQEIKIQLAKTFVKKHHPRKKNDDMPRNNIEI